MHTGKHLMTAIIVSILFGPPVLAMAQERNMPMNNEDLKWGPAPGFLPAGAEMVLLDGDPAAPKPLTLRLKFPAGYKLPAHWHPTQENVTVLSGTFFAGMGDKLDENKSVALKPGGYMAIPVEMRHFAWTKEETVVQVDMIGPFAITYINSDDDPRS